MTTKCSKINSCITMVALACMHYSCLCSCCLCSCFYIPLIKTYSHSINCVGCNLFVICSCLCSCFYIPLIFIYHSSKLILIQSIVLGVIPVLCIIHDCMDILIMFCQIDVIIKNNLVAMYTDSPKSLIIIILKFRKLLRC